MTAGTRCPYCQSRSDLDDPVRCPGCGAVGHRDCWLEYGGCAIPGCSQTPRTAVAAPALAQQFPAQQFPAQPPPNTRPPPPPPTPPPPAQPERPPTPAGWFPDPAGSDRQRWWSGTAWTDHYHPPFGS